MVGPAHFRLGRQPAAQPDQWALAGRPGADVASAGLLRDL
jgi:hypothetical protein